MVICYPFISAVMHKVQKSEFSGWQRQISETESDRAMQTGELLLNKLLVISRV